MKKFIIMFLLIPAIAEANEIYTSISIVKVNMNDKNQKGGWAVAYGYNLQEVTNRSRYLCEEKNNQDCRNERLNVVTKNHCIICAYDMKPGGHASCGVGKSIEKAENWAMNKCGSKCIIVSGKCF